MWGPGPWGGPMWGFWWIFPLIGLLICLFFVFAIVRMIGGGGRFMCMGSHHHDSEETAQLRREVEELREQVRKQGSPAAL
jgi:hypothetical protein